MKTTIILSNFLDASSQDHVRYVLEALTDITVREVEHWHPGDKKSLYFAYRVRKKKSFFLSKKRALLNEKNQRVFQKKLLEKIMRTSKKHVLITLDQERFLWVLHAFQCSLNWYEKEKIMIVMIDTDQRGQYKRILL